MSYSQNNPLMREALQGLRSGSATCELSGAVRKSKAITLGEPVMPVADGFDC
jgi:hypothetical protein